MKATRATGTHSISFIAATRIAASCVLGILSLLLFSFPFIDDGVDRTIKHSIVIEDCFSDATKFLNAFMKDQGRLPTELEFSKWTHAQPNNAPSNSFTLLTEKNTFPQEITERFGSPPDGGYVVEYWRGEWSEYYASWSNKSTLIFDVSEYYITGSKILDSSILCIS